MNDRRLKQVWTVVNLHFFYYGYKLSELVLYSRHYDALNKKVVSWLLIMEICFFTLIKKPKNRTTFRLFVRLMKT